MKRAYLRAGNALLIFIIAWTLPGCGAPPAPAATPTAYRTAAAQPDTLTPYPTDTPPPVLTATRTPLALPTLTTIAKAELKFDQPAVTADPFNDPGGPFFHQVWKAVSKDGLNFAKEGGVVFDKASVPDIIRLPSGRLIIYAVDGALRSRSGLMVAISDDNGMTWQQGSLQMTRPGSFGGADPEVVQLSDGRLRLYFVVFPQRLPRPGVIDPNIKNQVRSAVSSDGIRYEEEEGIRFEYPQITDPDVVKIGNKWWMYLAQGPRLIAASSADGLSFQLEKTIREQGSVSNTVPLGDNRWRQFYCAGGGIQSALSSDGLTWQDENGFRLQAEQSRMMCDPAPVQIGSTWLLFYKIGPMPPKPPRP